MPPASMLWTRASDASASAAAYKRKPDVSITKPPSQVGSSRRSWAECNGRRIDSTGRAAAASCSRRYARFVSTVDTNASSKPRTTVSPMTSYCRRRQESSPYPIPLCHRGRND